MQFNHNDEQQGLTVDDTAKAYLHEAARWGKFISIFGIVVSCLALLFAILLPFTPIGAIYGGIGAPLFAISFIYILLILACMYPYIALLRFSIKVKEAILLDNNDVLNSSFRFLKNHFKSIGIIIIVMISIYVLLFLFLLVMGGVAALAS